VAHEDLASLRNWCAECFGDTYTITEGERVSSHVLNLDGDAFVELRVVEAVDSEMNAGFQEFLSSEILETMEQWG
jgi:hypothetical protein